MICKYYKMQTSVLNISIHIHKVKFYNKDLKIFGIRYKKIWFQEID